jgi:hypothetical protein
VNNWGPAALAADFALVAFLALVEDLELAAALAGVLPAEVVFVADFLAVAEDDFAAVVLLAVDVFADLAEAVFFVAAAFLAVVFAVVFFAPDEPALDVLADARFEVVAFAELLEAVAADEPSLFSPASSDLSLTESDAEASPTAAAALEAPAAMTVSETSLAPQKILYSR